MGRAANKATSILHTTRRPISDSQGGSNMTKDQRGCKELTVVGHEGPWKWHQFQCRSSAGPTNLACRLWQIFSGNTRDKTPLNLGVNSWRMKMQGRSRSYLIAYSKYAERWVSAWRRERWSWTRPNLDELPNTVGNEDSCSNWLAQVYHLV